MTREEMMRSFVNAPERCRQNCPYQDRCQRGDFCVFKEAALIMSADKERIGVLERQIKMLRDLIKMVGDYGSYMEACCFDYYDMIHDYNGGAVKEMRLEKRRKKAARRRRQLKKLRNHELMDGDPRYAEPVSEPKEKIEEVIV